MTPLDRAADFAPSPLAIAIVRERLQQMGFPVSESAARGLLDAVLAVEGPRMYLQLRGVFENSLEIIRDTAETALGTVPKAAAAPNQIAPGRHPVPAQRPVQPPDDDFDGDEPRPVFKRPRR